jgi:uncharacterized protein YndB with AHSA1/START domain
LYLTRIYDAPVQAVWDAWTDPQQVAKWWGPRGFTITTHSKDLRVGGHWRYTMHGTDGVDYPNHTVYHEVEPLKKLVYDHGGYEDRPPIFRVTVHFTEENGKTRLDFTMACASPEAAQQTKKFVKSAGGESTWDRLAEYLGDQRGQHTFSITRSFETSIDTMYDLWTKPEHIAKWLPPTGMQMRLVRGTIRAGESIVAELSDGKSFKMYGRFHYRELRRPDRIVYAQEFVDANENPSRHPASPTWPAMMLTTVTLAEDKPGQTRVTIQWQPTGPTTAEEIKTFLDGRTGMTQGWTGSFEKLEALIGGE